jgi:hypothetical protein
LSSRKCSFYAVFQCFYKVYQKKSKILFKNVILFSRNNLDDILGPDLSSIYTKPWDSAHRLFDFCTANY